MTISIDGNIGDFGAFFRYENVITTDFPAWMREAISKGEITDEVSLSFTALLDRDLDGLDELWFTNGHVAFHAGCAYLISPDFDGYTQFSSIDAIHTDGKLLTHLKLVAAIYVEGFARGVKAGENQKAMEVRHALGI